MYVLCAPCLRLALLNCCHSSHTLPVCASQPARYFSTSPSSPSSPPLCNASFTGCRHINFYGLQIVSETLRHGTLPRSCFPPLSWLCTSLRSNIINCPPRPRDAPLPSYCFLLKDLLHFIWLCHRFVLHISRRISCCFLLLLLLLLSLSSSSCCASLLIRTSTGIVHYIYTYIASAFKYFVRALHS